MASVAAIRLGNMTFSDADLRSAQWKVKQRAERYGHRAAVVLSRSCILRGSLENALFARGALVANLTTLPSLTHVQDLMASGLIVLAPPDRQERPNSVHWIDVEELASTQESVKAVLSELERQGVLHSREDVLPGEGI